MTVKPLDQRHGDLRALKVLRSLDLDYGDSSRVGWLYELRVRADYREESVDEATAIIAADSAAGILARLGVPHP